MKNLILRGAKGTVFWLSLIFMLFLTAVSLVSTAYFNQADFYGEHPRYRMDNILINLIFIFLVLAVLVFLNAKGILEKIPIKGLAAAAVLVVIAASILWVRGGHT